MYKRRIKAELSTSKKYLYNGISDRKLVYEIVEKDVKNKKMIDELRTRNGNLPIVCQRLEELANGL